MYEYKCIKCGKMFEKIESFTASPKKKCPKCGAKAERQVSASSMQFKGSGWYVSDYGKQSSSGDGAKKEQTAASDSKADSKGDSKSDAKGDSGGDSKSDPKSESKPGKAGESKETATAAKSTSSGKKKD